MNRNVLVGVGACVTVVVAAFPPSAAAKGFRRSPQVVEVVTPLGLQGTAGAGGNVVIPFTIVDATGKPVDVEAQYGFDSNADGLIDDGEYRPAVEDRLDPRNTRANKAPQLFSTSVDGAAHGYVWRSLNDTGPAALRTFEYALTPQGRRIADPLEPGSWLFAQGVGGVKVRVRTVLVERRRHRRPRIRTTYGEWAYTNAFSLNNSNAPSARIDSVEEGATALVHWTAFDRDSEDLNGNGFLDVTNGEDIDGDGVLDREPVGVAFDFHWLADGENPSAMTDAQLAALNWLPCTRVPGVGDTDSLQTSPGVPIPATGDFAGVGTAPPGVGRQWVFAWNAELDAAGSTRGMILRATPFDAQHNRGAAAYSRIVVNEAE